MTPRKLWTAANGARCWKLFDGTDHTGEPRELWLVERHPEHDDAYVRVYADGRLESTRVNAEQRANDAWALLYVQTARRVLGLTAEPTSHAA